jgi:inorganic triphosphatase YgiF
MAEKRPEESEIKVLLKEEEADLLRARLGTPARTLRQISHFFETAQDHLARKEIALRLREESQPDESKRQLLLTVKEGGVRAGALMVRPEYESHIDQRLWDELMSGGKHFAEVDLPPIHRLKELLGDLSYLEIEDLGQIVNVREVYDLSADGLEMEVLLDRTEYPNGTYDVELETEMPQGIAGKAARVLRNLFAEAGIDWRPSEVGKYVRFRRKIGRDPATTTNV